MRLLLKLLLLLVLVPNRVWAGGDTVILYPAFGDQRGAWVEGRVVERRSVSDNSPAYFRGHP